MSELEFLKTINSTELLGNTESEYIDLGLPSGLLWASCNLGAEKPYEYGKYFQWGATVGYEGDDEALAHSTWETAPFNNGSEWLDSKYFNEHMSEWLDENGNMLKPEYDAVYVSTCGEAHITTKADFEELLSCTTNEWCQCIVLGDDKEHNVNGRLFTSKTNGNKIFIPAAGIAWSGSLYGQGSYAFLCSSSLLASNHNYAWILYFGSGYCGMYNNDRAYGFSVRGVRYSN